MEAKDKKIADLELDVSTWRQEVVNIKAQAKAMQTDLNDSIDKLEKEKATLLREISLKNINLIEVEKENNKLKEEKEELKEIAERRHLLIQEEGVKNTKLKQQIKELEEYSNHQGLTTHQRFLKMSEILNKNN